MKTTDFTERFNQIREEISSRWNSDEWRSNRDHLKRSLEALAKRIPPTLEGLMTIVQVLFGGAAFVYLLLGIVAIKIFPFLFLLWLMGVVSISTIGMITFGYLFKGGVLLTMVLLLQWLRLYIQEWRQPAPAC